MIWFSNSQPDVVSIRYLEVLIASYTFISGSIFRFFSEGLTAPVYEPWRDLGIHTWGTLMLCVSMLHVSALIWNGRNALMSRICRSLACSSHAAIMITFGIYFYQVGAVWGCVLFLFLLPCMLFPIVHRLNGEIKWIRRGAFDSGDS